MTLFILCGIGSSSSRRIYILSLITLVFVCSFSYCSSSLASSVGSSNVHIGNNVDNFDTDKNINDEDNLYYRLPYRPSSFANYHLNANKKPTLSRSYLLNLVLKSALTQQGDHPNRQSGVHVDDRRHIHPQSFHAMRG